MSQGLDIDLKEIVLSNSSFGPIEIEQLTPSDFGGSIAIGCLRDAVARTGGQRRLDAGDGGAAGRLLLPAGTTATGDRDAVAMPTAVRWRCSIWADAQFALSNYRRGDRALQRGRRRRLQRAISVRLAICEAQRYTGDAAGRAGHAGPAVRRGRADGRVPLPARRHRGRTGRQPDEVVALYERAVDVDRRIRGLVRPGLENDRRGNDDAAPRAVRAGGAAAFRRTSARC